MADQAVLAVATHGEPPDAYLHRATLSLEPIARGASAYDSWRGLTLSLPVDGPLRLVLHDDAKSRYAELFRFLLLVKRVQMELHAAWATQSQAIHLPAAHRAQLLPLWRLRAHMAFLIDNLQVSRAPLRIIP